MSCRSTPGSSACVTVACREHGLEDAQVQSVLHDALRQARNEGREASERAFARHLERVNDRVGEDNGLPARQLQSLRTRLAEGAQPDNMPDGHRRAAILDLDARAALAKRHLDGFIDDAAVRYGEPAEKTQARYAAARAAAVADSSLTAPDQFVAGLQKGAFTWGAPRDRATAYALHKVAEGLGYRAPADQNGPGVRPCPECGEFMGDSHTCAPAATGTAAPTGPGNVAAPGPVVAVEDAWVENDEYDDGYDEEDDEGERYYDQYGDPQGYPSGYSITERFDDGEKGPEIAVVIPVRGIPVDAPLAPERAASEPAVAALHDTVESLLTGQEAAVPAAVLNSGQPITALSGVVAVDLANGPLPVLNRNRPATAPVSAGTTPPLTLDQEMETFTDLSRARQSLDETISAMETDLAARLDESQIRELTDDATGVTVSPVGGVRYSQWDKERLLSDISIKIAERDGLDAAEVQATVAEYAKYAQVDQRFRTRQLRALGLRARDYAESEDEPRTIDITYEADPGNSAIRTDGLAYRFRHGMTRLNGSVSDLAAARDRVRTAPLPEAVRSLAAAKRMQDRLSEASEQVEDRLISRMRGNSINNIMRNGTVIGTVHTPRPYRSWDIDRTSAAVTGKIAADSDRPVKQVSAVVDKLTEIAPVSGFRVRQLPALGLNADDYSGNTTPRTRIKWAST